MKLRPLPGRLPRILVVDDDDHVRTGLARALEHQWTCQVDIARDGFEAGYKLAKFAPDLILLDVVMPGMDGLQVCRRMRELVGTEPLKIIILTGYAGPDTSEGSLVSGADLYLMKPVDVDVILGHVQELLER